MITRLGPTGQELAAVRALQHGDIIHITAHDVFRHSRHIHTVACCDADVQVDCLITVEGVIVICWRGCASPAVCGATAYDADDCVLRLETAAA